jgi:hypothetical protein
MFRLSYGLGRARSGVKNAPFGARGTVSAVSEQQRAGARSSSAPVTEPDGYPGEDLGLPSTGSGSIVGMGRKLGALFVDWFLCTFIVVALIRPAHADVEYWTLAVFALQDCLLTALTGFTIGKRLFGVRVVRLDGKLVGAWSLVRTILLLFVIPAVVQDRDQRGLHDRAANTVVVRL